VRPALISEAEEHDDGSVEPDHVFVSESTDAFTELHPSYRRQLVDHQAARFVEPILTGRRYEATEEWRLRRISRERTDRDRVGRIESIILDDNDRSGLAGVARSGSRGPDLAAPHTSSTESASTKSWSSFALGDDATSAL
jgi:hypothetical protein